jgi:hypothetical protein
VHKGDSIFTCNNNNNNNNNNNKSRTQIEITNKTVFDVDGSVYLGNVYVQLNVQLDVLIMYSLFFSIP